MITRLKTSTIKSAYHQYMIKQIEGSCNNIFLIIGLFI